MTEQQKQVQLLQLSEASQHLVTFGKNGNDKKKKSIHKTAHYIIYKVIVKFYVIAHNSTYFTN